ncbi:hypothetical protein [Parasphingorhabdus sp.]|uniref:hypothetical protein n=1 Tax=Parasphingorhabdus sp. TaxID=2709688 RepID=UPI00326376A7
MGNQPHITHQADQASKLSQRQLVPKDVRQNGTARAISTRPEIDIRHNAKFLKLPMLWKSLSR